MSMTQTQQHNVPALRFPEFSGEWEKNRFDSFSSIIRGASPRPKGDPRYYGSGVPRLMVQDVARDGKYVDPIIDSLTYEGAKLSRYCQKGTLTVVCSGTAKTVGQASILKRDACIHDGFLALTNIKDEFAHEFIYYQILRLQDQAERLATHGGTFINLTTSILKEFSRFFPALSEQQQIASFLSSVDGKIEQLGKKKALLGQYKKGMMQKLFSQELRFKDAQGNDFPDWEEKQLGDAATFKKGKGISKADIVEDGKNKCIRYGELYTVYNERIETVVSLTNTKIGCSILSEGNDVLMPTSDVTPNGLATASALDEAGIILGGDILIVRSPQILNLFFCYYVSAHKSQVMRLVSGVTVYHIYGSDMATLKMNIPSLPEQQKIADFLSSIDRKINLVSAEINHANTFKKGLLQQMFI